MVQLTDELIGELDAEAHRRGLSRSALIREVLDAYLGGLRSLDVGRRIVAGYTAVPQATPDAWGAVDRFSDRGAGELATRLDEEERRAGRAPW